MKHGLLLTAATCVLLAGCIGTDEGQRLAEGDLQVNPASAQPGDVVEVSFPEGHLRPNVVTIHSYDGRGRWEATYAAATGRVGDQDLETVPADEMPWELEFAPADDEPDIIRLPADLEPGDHQVCATIEGRGAEPTPACGKFEVVE